MKRAIACLLGICCVLVITGTAFASVQLINDCTTITLSGSYVVASDQSDGTVRDQSAAAGSNEGYASLHLGDIPRSTWPRHIISFIECMDPLARQPTVTKGVGSWGGVDPFPCCAVTPGLGTGGCCCYC